MSYEEALEHHKFPHKPGAKFDFLVFIGRFQPFHLGHLKAVRQALELSTNVIIVIGSAGGPRSHRNPWTALERMGMIEACLFDEELARITYLPVEDRLYNHTAWIEAIQSGVADIVADRHDFTASPKVGLIGHYKDESSYYLSLFPQWEFIPIKDAASLAATKMREGIFSNIAEVWLHGSGEYLHPEVANRITAFAKDPEYKEITEEYEFIRKYRESWAKSPYQPVFVTTDAVIVQSGHILLVERGARPGRGQLALPGGYLKPELSLLDSMITEVREETRIALDDSILKRSIVVGPKVFDDPFRDPRGRFITNAFLIVLNPKRSDDFRLPIVKGGSDAARARWVPLAEVKREEMFADHADIINNMTAQL